MRASAATGWPSREMVPESGPAEAGGERHQGGFAGAVGAEEAEEFAWGDVERDVVERDERAVVFRDGVEGEHGAGRSGLSEDGLERANVSGEGLAAGGGGGDEGAGLAVDEGFFDGDVAGFFEGEEMCAEVAVGEAEFGFEVGEIDLFARAEVVGRRHDLESDGLVDDGIEFGHRGQRQT